MNDEIIDDSMEYDTIIISSTFIIPITITTIIIMNMILNMIMSMGSTMTMTMDIISSSALILYLPSACSSQAPSLTLQAS